MNLVSLVNSGESIEKTLSLYFSAIKYNKSFYDNFDKVLLFYDENLRKHRGESFAHGSIGANISYLSRQYDIKYKTEDDLWGDKEEILNTLFLGKRLTERNIEKLSRNFSRYIEVVCNLPMELIDKKFYKNVLHNFSLEHKNVELVKLNLRDNFLSFLENLPDDSSAQLHILDTEGSIGNRVFQTPLILKEKTSFINFVDKSVVVSGNVYVFLMKIQEFLKNTDKDWIVACRKKSMLNRDSSRKGLEQIELLKENATITEPKNDHFNEILNSLKPLSYSNEDLVNKSVYKNFLDFTR